MSPFVRKLILTSGAIALVMGTVRGMAALPATLHAAGIDAPQSWEQVLVEGR